MAPMGPRGAADSRRSSGPVRARAAVPPRCQAPRHQAWPSGVGEGRARESLGQLATCRLKVNNGEVCPARSLGSERDRTRKNARDAAATRLRVSKEPARSCFPRDRDSGRDFFFFFFKEPL